MLSYEPRLNRTDLRATPQGTPSAAAPATTNSLSHDFSVASLARRSAPPRPGASQALPLARNGGVVWALLRALRSLRIVWWRAIRTFCVDRNRRAGWPHTAEW